MWRTGAETLGICQARLGNENAARMQTAVGWAKRSVPTIEIMIRGWMVGTAQGRLCPPLRTPRKSGARENKGTTPIAPALNPFTKPMRRLADGTIHVAVADRRAASDPRSDLGFRRPQLGPLQNQQTKRRPQRAAFFVFRGCSHFPRLFNQPLPPITARTVSSGPKSSAPST